MNRKNIILGAGITGLSAGLTSKMKIYETRDIPGGICSSYYAIPGGKISYTPLSKDSYRFETGGGHWIFGDAESALSIIGSLSTLKIINRKSAVYFPSNGKYIPYPLQNYIGLLPKDLRDKALSEISDEHKENKEIVTQADWLEANFGKTLCGLFFFPFHELYTAGLYTQVVPCDKYKTPVNRELIVKAAKEDIIPVGYNTSFRYPVKGLNDLIGNMADKCNIEVNKKVTAISLSTKEIVFGDGNQVEYERIFSTLPLNRVLEIAGLNIGKPDPFTSVLVINIGARKGKKCPDYHWVYVPESKAGFYRVGFYSNVDRSFLPKEGRTDNSRVSIYVEKAYPGGDKPPDAQIDSLSGRIAFELKEWGYIDTADVISPTWIDIAYTYEYPGSTWRQDAIKELEKHSIYQIGRYGRWRFQGILDSVKDGMSIVVSG